jgi:transmembrane sensor
VKKLVEDITAIPQWDKTAKQIWNERFDALTSDSSDTDEKETFKAKTVGLRPKMIYILSSVAVVLFLFSAMLFMYTKNVNALPGKLSITHLPDGSLVEVSSGSSISYHPLLWMISPKVKMTGEAFFSGRHTRGFSVKTEAGDINVLGTTFNAKSYNGILEVACIEGKVEVKEKNMFVVLTANMQTKIEKGKKTTSPISDSESVVGWTKGIFSFYDKPLADVLKDVERYFDVKIAAPAGIDTLRYTGRFTREKTPQEVLAIIGQPYGLTFKIIK